MSKTNHKIFTFLCLIFLSAPSICAQEQTEIKDIFDRYGKQKGSILVQLSSDVLSEGSNLSFYKSLMIKQIEDKEKDNILSGLYTNKQNWTVISELVKGGSIRSGTYQIASSNKMNTYLLVKNSGSKLTIIYIKGDFLPQNLDKELNKLKDLFIYANNKRIQIN